MSVRRASAVAALLIAAPESVLLRTTACSTSVGAASGAGTIISIADCGNRRCIFSYLSSVSSARPRKQSCAALSTSCATCSNLAGAAVNGDCGRCWGQRNRFSLTRRCHMLGIFPAFHALMQARNTQRTTSPRDLPPRRRHTISALVVRNNIASVARQALRTKLRSCSTKIAGQASRSSGGMNRVVVHGAEHISSIVGKSGGTCRVKEKKKRKWTTTTTTKKKRWTKKPVRIVEGQAPELLPPAEAGAGGGRR